MPHPERFYGTFEHSLDDKGRLILPAKIREHLAGSTFLTRHHESCLALWNSEEFDQETEEMLLLDTQGPRERNAFRDWAANVHPAEIDKQGRMPIPQSLRDFAGLQQKVIVNGAVTRIELWSPERWASKLLPPEPEEVAGPSSTPDPSSQPPVSSN